MKVLVIGNGGREHALAWKLAQSPETERVFVAPGNGGTALDQALVNVPITDLVELVAWARGQSIDVVVVGPEAPLAAGAVDLFRDAQIPVFGPTKAAAQLESSKAFSKAFMARHNIPTAAFESFTDVEAAHAYIDRMGAPIVVKADGLAAGKGVVVAMTTTEAHAAVDDMLLENRLGVTHNAAGARVVIEAFLEGEEASFIVVCDGKTVVPLATSQDHKRLQTGALGPNTGGMGAYSPAPVVTPAVYAKAMSEVIMPTIEGMAKDGIPFTGFLYAGLMITPAGDVKTLEFNCRMGDPETQPIMMRLTSSLAELMLAGATGRLDRVTLTWDDRPALGVVLAAAGYPADPRKGDLVTGVPAATADSVVFHAGTTLQDDELRSSGGRVLCATALGTTIEEAQTKAYGLLGAIKLEGAQYRTDIGARAIR
ncbi:MAG: phosphoribosylamine--glycine ligase [Burkholderiaceae bacterium]